MGIEIDSHSLKKCRFKNYEYEKNIQYTYRADAAHRHFSLIALIRLRPNNN